MEENRGTGAPAILVVGAGAVGAFFGSALARQGALVSVVCRSEFEDVRAKGFEIASGLLGNHTFRPHRVLRETADYGATPDFVVLSSKVLPSVDRVALLRPVVGPATTIVLIQNGIDIEQEICAAFPRNELLSALAFIGVARTGGGRIHHQSSGWLILGRYPDGITVAAQQLAALLEASGVGCRLTEDVIGARWQKAVWNAAFNPISIMGGVLDTTMMLRTADDQAFVRRVMQEICAIAAALGHPQSPKLVDQLIGHTIGMAGYKTSMALDFENRRPMEIEAILGNTVRAGQRAGVAIPALETLYALAKMIEGKQAASA
jgi:2-dehydropantoate 2-reductase